MDGWYAVHFSLFSIAAYNLSRSYHSPFQNNQMPAGYVGLLSFGFCFRKVAIIAKWVVCFSKHGKH